MSQFDFGVIDPNVKTGTQLAADLNQWRTAVHSTHAGAARPAYAQPGMLWVDQTSGTDWKLKLATASGDTVIGGINPTTNQLGPARFPDGTAAAPAISWISSPTSGFHHLGAGVFRYVINSARIFSADATTFLAEVVFKAISPGAGVHEFTCSTVNDFALRIVNGSGGPQGLDVSYSSTSIRDTSHWHILCHDTGGNVFAVVSNGGVYNFSANNVNLSDERAKENIAPAPDHTAFVGQLQYKRFNYTGQADEIDDVTAQDLEAIAPDLVVPFDDAGMKGVHWYRVQQRINSVIPKLIARIQQLEAKLP